MIPTLEQLQQSALITLDKAPTMSLDELGSAWVMVKSAIDKYRKNSPESLLLLKLQKQLDEHRKEARKHIVHEPTAVELERQANKD